MVAEAAATVQRDRGGEQRLALGLVELPVQDSGGRAESRPAAVPAPACAADISSVRNRAVKGALDLCRGRCRTATSKNLSSPTAQNTTNRWVYGPHPIYA